MNINSRDGFENELTYSPLHQLELQMALSNGGNMKRKQSTGKAQVLKGKINNQPTTSNSSIHIAGGKNDYSNNEDAHHLDGGESIYSFDSVSTNGRLLDRLYLDDDNNEDNDDIDNWMGKRNSVFSNQSTGRLLDRLGLEEQAQAQNQHYNAPMSRTASAKQKLKSSSSSSLLSLGSLSRRKSSRKHIPIPTNASSIGLNRTPSVPKNKSRGRVSPPLNRNGSTSSITNSIKTNSTSNSTSSNNNEYTVGNVGSKIVQSDNKSIFSFQADMASLESVATISQKIPTPLSSPMTRSALDYASKRDTVDLEDYSADIFASSDEINTSSITPKLGRHKHTNSLPEPNLDQSPQAFQRQQQRQIDDLDEFQFTPSPTEGGYTSGQAAGQPPPLVRTHTEPAPQVRPLLHVGASTGDTPKSTNNLFQGVNSSPTSSMESRRSTSTSHAERQSPGKSSPIARGGERRIASEPSKFVSRSMSSSSIASASPNSKFSKTDLTPSARTNWAQELRNAGNHREASYQLQLAANIPNNYPKAMYLYAMALRYGQGVKLNERNSIKWLLRCLLVVQNTTDTQSQSNNDYVSKLVDISPEDLVLIMNRYITSEPEVDPIQLYDYYSKLPAAQLTKLITSIKSQSNIIASTYHEVGNCLINGWGLQTKDEMSGILYLSKAGSMGNIASMAQLGEIWSSKSKLHKKDYFRASAWLRLSELFGTKSIGNSWIYKEKYIKVTKQ
ncbi:hypothetical protein CLIB1423_06S06942 [[Candida] railenensis]|uniref:Protein DSF2 n=1 Tax=[Candida] railenensis TaxID=45579 RepID=A0A9P0QPE6_9ASCO|nr:hypothetical protein CLIB1423_06S06942 [[Candida] railenensis]